MMNNELISLLQQEIQEKNETFEKLDQSLFKDLMALKDIISKIIQDHTNISEFDLNDLTRNLDIDLETITKIEMYQFFSKTRNFSLETSQIEELNVIFSSFKDKIALKEKEFLKNNPDYIKLNLEIQNLNKVKQKLVNNNNLTIVEFKLLCEIIRKNIKDIDKCLELITSLSKQICLSYTDSKNELNIQYEEQDEIIDVNITSLSLDDLSELFKKYNYTLDDFKDFKDLLVQYGNLINIENILKVLSENNIQIEISKNKENFARILTLSTSDIVQTIINNIKNDINNSNNMDYDLNKIFLLCLRQPSIFIKALKRYVGTNKNNNSSNSDTIEGAYQNYILNRQLFLELGLDINKALSDCLSAFTIPHEKVKGNIKTFELYKIDKSIYLNTLTCMSASNPLDVIDKFIEIGCYDYIISNFSYVGSNNQRKNDSIYYQIKNARNQGYTIDDFYNYAKTTKKIIGLKRETFLSKFNGTSLDGEPEYHSELENSYKEIDFSIFEPISDSVLNNYFISNLENIYKQDELTYNFNGIIISRYKVLRIYAIFLKKGMANDLNSLMYSITRGSLLTKEEYDMIGECLNYVYLSGGVIR